MNKNNLSFKFYEGPDPYSREGRIALAGMVLKFFEHWGLTPEDQLTFLGLSKGSRGTLARYRSGKPMANRRDLMDRVGNLLTIHRSLRILYRNNREIICQWMISPNSDFDGRSPADIIRTRGFVGLLQVRNYLDFERER